MSKSRELKVLIVLTSATFQLRYSHWGDVIERLNKYCEVVLLLDEHPPENCLLNIGAAKIHVVKLPSKIRRHQILRYLLVVPIMVFSGLKEACEVNVLLTFSGGPSQIVAYILSRLVRRPLVTILRANPSDWSKTAVKGFFRNALFKLHDYLTRYILRNSSNIVAIYKHLYYYAREIGVKRQNLTLMYLGVDLTKYKYNYKISQQDDFIVGFVGRLSIENGVDRIIEVAKLLPSVKFVLVGGPKLANIPSNVIITGYVPNENVPYFLSMFDLFLSLKRVKGLPRAVIEALACGVPIVGVNIDELQVKHSGAIILRRYDPKAIATIINLLKNDLKLRLTLSKYARDFAEKTFDINSNILKLYLTIRRLQTNTSSN